jgi:ankyrin repeat protein
MGCATSKSDGRQLYHAAAVGALPEVRELLSKPNAPSFINWKNSNWNRRTPTHVAAVAGHTEVVKTLIGARADVNAADKDGITPTNMAVSSGKKEVLEVVKTLIDARADVNSADKHGYTPAHNAVKRENTELLEVLIGARADVNARDEWFGGTPTTNAATNGRTGMLKVLIGAGGDVNAREKNGETPMYRLASAHPKPETVDPNTETVEILIGLRADVNARNSDFKTPIYGAAFYGNTKMVKFLIGARADVNAADLYGATPTYAAARNNPDQRKRIFEHFSRHHSCVIDSEYMEVVKALCGARADVNAATTGGENKEHANVVTAMRRYGWSPPIPGAHFFGFYYESMKRKL